MGGLRVGIAVAFATLLGTAAGATEPPLLHVPSPDWRDQIIYFAMIDRFDDGDPANNDQGEGEYDPRDGAKWSGGDLAGLARRVDYLRELGVTALWITPPVANQWWDPLHRYGGYHGYWAEHFAEVDRHFGSLDDYRRLSDRLHRAGMYLVQDVVVNHTGNFFRYDAARDPADPTRGYTLLPQPGGRRGPRQAPFDRNDPRREADRAAGIYHWTPDIVDFTVREQELNGQLAGLDDLDTENPAVRRALRASYGHWIREVGVDAFRVDTAFYVPPEYFDDFLAADDPEAPGVLRVAAATGRRDFHVFGEGFGIDPPFTDAQARRIDAYMRSAGTALPGMINFPLYGTGLDVFARGRPTAAYGHRIRSMLALHARAHRMPTFVDNHDVDRFLSGGSEAGLKQALLAILTLPGIPTIYYGTEQGFRGQRDAMFAGGVGSGGRDRFDTASPMFRWLAGAIALRRAHPLFSRGMPTVVAENAAGPGALAWRTTHGDETALVVFNTAEHPVLLDNLETGLAPGTLLEPLFGIDGPPDRLTVGAGGRVHRVLPPRSGQVWRATAQRARPPRPRVALTLDPPPASPVAGDLAIRGTARGTDDVLLVPDGDLGAAVRVTPDADGRFAATLDTSAMLDAAVPHRLVAWSATHATASAPATFRVARAWTALARVDDPAGDDTGPDGRYVYPGDPAWAANRPLDLLGAQLEGSGGALALTVRVNRVLALWNPANGFDHLALTIFIELPDATGGATVMPLQNASLPAGLRWHRRLRAHGWSNAMFTAEGATAEHEGMPVTPAPGLTVDRAAHTLRFTVTPAALGRPRTLAGARIHVTTWDWDGGYRALAPQAGTHVFGGGDGARDPKVMDTLTLEVPR